jgi:hypothetical protein
MSLLYFFHFVELTHFLATLPYFKENVNIFIFIKISFSKLIYHFLSKVAKQFVLNIKITIKLKKEIFKKPFLTYFDNLSHC